MSSLPPSPTQPGVPRHPARFRSECIGCSRLHALHLLPHAVARGSVLTSPNSPPAGTAGGGHRLGPGADRRSRAPPRADQHRQCRGDYRLPQCFLLSSVQAGRHRAWPGTRPAGAARPVPGPWRRGRAPAQQSCAACSWRYVPECLAMPDSSEYRKEQRRNVALLGLTVTASWFVGKACNAPRRAPEGAERARPRARAVMAHPLARPRTPAAHADPPAGRHSPSSAIP